MRKNRLIPLILILCLICGAEVFFVMGDEVQAQPLVIRFGYVQSRPYGFYAQELLDIAREMAEAGTLRGSILTDYEEVNFEEHFAPADMDQLWNDICDACMEGARYQFVREAFFDMSTMEEADYQRLLDIMDFNGVLTGRPDFHELVDNETAANAQ